MYEALRAYQKSGGSLQDELSGKDVKKKGTKNSRVQRNGHHNAQKDEREKDTFKCVCVCVCVCLFVCMLECQKTNARKTRAATAHSSDIYIYIHIYIEKLEATLQTGLA